MKPHAKVRISNPDFRVWGLGIFGALCVALAGVLANVPETRSATLAYMSDTIGNPLISVSTNHDIAFVTPSGVGEATDTITVTFNGFDLSQITINDVDFAHGSTTGLETSETLAASAAPGVWGYNLTGQVMTFTPPTDCGATEVGASSTVRVLIGTNASGGANQITNPATADNYVISFAGSFGDTGAIGVPVVGNNQVSVTASYPPPPAPEEEAGGHGGTPPDTTPPVLMTIQATNIGETSARITWNTDEQASSVVDFGHTITYASGTVSDATGVTSHAIDLTGLLSCQTYHYRVTSSDAAGNIAVSTDYVFTTLCDTTPPVLSDIHAGSITDTSAIILWTTNEPSTSFLEYGLTTSYGLSTSDGGFVTSHALPIAGLLPNTTYHYRVRSVDSRGNTTTSSDLTFTTAPDATPPANVFFTATAGDGAVGLGWTNPTDPDFAGVRIVRRSDRFPTNPTDGTIIYNGAGTSFSDTGLTNGTTYYYGAFAYDTNGNFASGALASATPQAPPPENPPPENPPPENPPPTVPPPTVPPPTIPPIVTPPIQPPPVNPPTIPTGGVTTTPPTPSATIYVNFIGANGTLPLAKDARGAVGVRAGAPMTVSVPAVSMNGDPDIVVYILGTTTFNLSYDSGSNAYTGTVPVPALPGTYATKGQAVFEDGRVAEQMVSLIVKGPGLIYERSLVGGRVGVPGAVVRLFREKSGTYAPWDGSAYGQRNPQATNGEGFYLFEVPPGRYYLQVEKNGFEVAKTDPVFIEENVFNASVALIRIPTNVAEAIDRILTSTSTPVEKAAAIAKSVTENVIYQAKKLQQDVIESPEVQQVNREVVPPTAVTITVVNAASALNLFNLIAYLQYLFMQPFLLIWKRKRRAYGTVYDSLTKRPVDLAIVRLIHIQSGLTVQTRVTDKHGRYIMDAKPGVYRIEVVKPEYTFPSFYLGGKTVDVDYTDLYHGIEFTVREDAPIAFNIPVDPSAPEEVPRKILFRKTMRRFQHLVAFSGVVISAISFLITPTAMMSIFVGVQIIVYVVFRRLSLPERPKKLGRVFDLTTKKALPRAIVRIFDSKFNKLLETQITDSRGRYGFLVGKNVFYVTGEAKGYATAKMPELDLTKGEGVVDQSIPLARVTTLTPDALQPKEPPKPEPEEAPAVEEKKSSSPFVKF